MKKPKEYFQLAPDDDKEKSPDHKFISQQYVLVQQYYPQKTKA